MSVSSSQEEGILVIVLIPVFLRQLGGIDQVVHGSASLLSQLAGSVFHHLARHLGQMRHQRTKGTDFALRVVALEALCHSNNETKTRVESKERGKNNSKKTTTHLAVEKRTEILRLLALLHEDGRALGRLYGWAGVQVK